MNIPPPAIPDSHSEVSRSLKLYLAVLLGLTAIAVCAVGVRGHIFHESYPRNSLFVQPEIRFSDFTDLAARVAHFGERDMLTRTDISTPYPYPVPSVYVYLFFVRLFRHPLAGYLAFDLLVFIVAASAISFYLLHLRAGALPQLAIWATLFFGFPLWFLLDRGNIESVVWLLVLLGIWAYAKDRTIVAALLLGAAASIKIFPGLLFLLFLAKRKYGAFALAIATAGLFTVGALAGVGPTIRQALSDSSKSEPFLKDTFIETRVASGFDHSVFQLVKQGIYVYKGGEKDPAQIRPAFERAFKLYSIFIPLGALLLYFFHLRRLPVLNQLVVYLVLCILLPYVSYEYTLVYLYLVWAVFLLFLLTDILPGRVRIPSKAIWRTMLSCAVVFSPLGFLILGHSFGFGGQIKTVFLLVILWVFLRIPMPSSIFGDLPASRALSSGSKVGVHTKSLIAKGVERI